MNILWIEDFGGGLPTGTGTLNSMFQDLISFDNWDEDELSLLRKPSDLEIFFKENSALNCVFLCRHYFDYVEFKANNELAKRIDAVIIDIRLENQVDFSLPIPSDSHTKANFHKEAGFYIFNDLIHLGFPAEKMCFMTGEKGSFSGFKKQCDDIYIPEVVGFEKIDAEFGKLRQWIKDRQSDYANLRRGVIDGCEFLKSHVGKDDSNIQFREFIKTENNQPTIEIPSTEIKNYLDALSQFLALKEQNDQNIQYRLFLRTLVHEWEENIDPNKKYKDNDIHTFAWLSKMTRNWTSHANLLEPLNSQILAFLFMVNMRAMFKIPPETQPFEEILLSCISTSKEIDDSLENKIEAIEDNINNTLLTLKIPEYKEDKTGKRILDRDGREKMKNFGDKINAIHQKNTGNPKQHDFKDFLLQYFWVNQKSKLDNLMANSDDFLPTLARHIYSRSFL